MKKIMFDNLEKLRENQRHNFERFDKFMLWIVGFSIGGISIIVTNLTELNTRISHSTSKSILLLLSLSIVSGILYRLAFYHLQVEYQAKEFFLHGAFSEVELMSFDPDDLTNETSIHKVISSLKIDFGEDFSYLLEDYASLPHTTQQNILEYLKDYYKYFGNGVKEEHEYALSYIKDVYKRAFGFSDKQLNNLFKIKSAKKFKVLSRLTGFFFLLTCLSFISVLVILYCSY